MGKVTNVKLDLVSAVCTIEWEKGAKARILFLPTKKGGRFLFENLPDALTVRLLTPQYEENEAALDYQPGVNKLTSLGYKLGKWKQIAPTTLLYHQQGWGDVSYEIAVNWNSLPGKNWKESIV